MRAWSCSFSEYTVVREPVREQKTSLKLAVKKQTKPTRQNKKGVFCVSQPEHVPNPPVLQIIVCFGF